MSDDWSSESGRLADPQRVLQQHRRILARYDADDETPPLELDWNDPFAREWVRERFDANGDDDILESTPGDGGEPLLPGFGPLGRAGLARDDCGDKHPWACRACGHVVRFGRTCSMSVCGRCGVAWVRDRAIAKSAKIRRVRKMKHQATPEKEHTKLHHQVVSPPLRFFAKLAMAGVTMTEAQEAAREFAKTVLDEQRAPGLLVRHSYRGVRDDGSIASESDDRGAWKERLNSGRDWYGDVREQLAWMPHFHAVVASDFVKGSGFVGVIEEETGWVVHRIADEDGISLAHDGAMARALTYTLSHADIELRQDGHNQSAVWEVGVVDGDPIASSGRFSAHPADLDWADAVVRRHASRTLGLASSTTECGVELPAVDDPDELAREIIEDLYPQHDGKPDADLRDAVPHSVAEGHLSVRTSSTSGGGGNVSVSASVALPDPGDAWTELGASGGFATSTAVAEDGGCDCPDHDDVLVEDDHWEESVDDDPDDRPNECDGQLVPLGELRELGLLEDDGWRRQAAHAAEALKADDEWPDDLEPWRSAGPGSAVGVG